uniref:Uncharacterized protein n=1 Tax=Lotharella vacuolata TaxID=74820 RepID=A0A0H5BHD2_9EUKA|nr:hypothetical protein [Lotharella vacuolata]
MKHAMLKKSYLNIVFLNKLFDFFFFIIHNIFFFRELIRMYIEFSKNYFLANIFFSFNEMQFYEISHLLYINYSVNHK